MTREQKIIYIAGYFDGEGHIGLGAKLSSNKSYQPRINIASTERKSLKFVQDLFGGRIIKQDRSKQVMKNGRVAKDCYYWKMSKYSDCRSFLEAIVPFLIVKKEQAELTIEYINSRLASGKKTWNPLTKEQEEMRLKIRAFTERGRKL